MALGTAAAPAGEPGDEPWAPVQTAVDVTADGVQVDVPAGSWSRLTLQG